MTAAGLTVLLGLGFWQLERKQWKEALIETLAQRSLAVPADLPSPENRNAMTAQDFEFRRVRLRAEFIEGARPAWVYVGGSALRADVKTPGYFVFSPARISGGQIVVVNRGYVTDRESTPPPVSMEIVGYLRWPQSPGWFVSDHDSSGDIWFAFDHRAMARARGWGMVAPFYIDQQSPIPAAGIPRPGPLTVALRNDHLGYALTWFGLAGALAAVFALWVKKQVFTRN